MDMHLWLAFVAASSALLLLPGPTVLLVLSYSISQGRRVALATVAGVALGDRIAMTASLAGLGVLVLTSATLFTILKWIGAAYLVFLGIRLFRTAPAELMGATGQVKQTSTWSVFGHATAVTALNPKSIVFFIAFVPQFIDIQLPLPLQFGILVFTFVGLATLNALAYVVLADAMRVCIARPSVLAGFQRLGGGMLVSMGIATAAVRQSGP